MCLRTFWVAPARVIATLGGEGNTQQRLIVLRRLVLQAFNRLVDVIETVIATGVRNRELRADLVPRRAARFLLATFEGDVMLSGVARDPSWFSDLRDDLRDVILSWSPGPLSRNSITRSALRQQSLEIQHARIHDGSNRLYRFVPRS